MQPHQYRSPFLDALPKHLITAVLKLLLSNHHFRTKTGRWNRTNKEERTCPMCGHLEDESHALFNCPRFLECRCQLIVRVPAGTHGELELWFIELIRSGAPDTIERSKAATFVRKILKDAKRAYHKELIIPFNESFKIEYDGEDLLDDSFFDDPCLFN